MYFARLLHFLDNFASKKLSPLSMLSTCQIADRLKGGTQLIKVCVGGFEVISMVADKNANATNAEFWD